MIQLVVNTSLLREIDETKILNAYARFVYNDESDLINDTQIQENLKEILDWDRNGEEGLGLYCSKFEKIKEKDWLKLVQLIKDNSYKIKKYSYQFTKKRKLESKKIVYDRAEANELRKKKRFLAEDYEVSGRGKKAKPCTYEGRTYKSRQECMYKEGLSKHVVWEYLKKTGQI